MQILSIIYTDVIDPVQLVSQTYTFLLDNCVLPANLNVLAYAFKNDPNVTFEPEIFPALSIHYWKPIHVNVFSTGKVIVLGRDAYFYLTEIYDWIFYNLLLLPNYV